MFHFIISCQSFSKQFEFN